MGKGHVTKMTHLITHIPDDALIEDLDTDQGLWCQFPTRYVRTREQPVIFYGDYYYKLERLYPWLEEEVQR